MALVMMASSSTKTPENGLMEPCDVGEEKKTRRRGVDKKKIRREERRRREEEKRREEKRREEKEERYSRIQPTAHRLTLEITGVIFLSNLYTRGMARGKKTW